MANTLLRNYIVTPLHRHHAWVLRMYGVCAAAAACNNPDLGVYVMNSHACACMYGVYVCSFLIKVSRNM
jgi:hypothetical protein